MKQLHTRQEVAAELERRGITIRQWARKHGFNHEAVRDVLRRDSPWRWGERFKIAVLLGIRDGILDADDYLP